MNSALEPELGVECVNKIVVRLNAAPWPFAIRHKESIRAFWREQQRCHPHFYDGQVHVMIAWEIHNAKTPSATFVGSVCRTNFASFLYWKSSAIPAKGEFDFSGGAAVICRDGALLMVVAGDHTIVPGTLEFPSGFVDVSDFDDSELNFDRHVEREATEEFVVNSHELGRPRQYIVVGANAIVQVLSTFVIDANGKEFVETWRARTCSDTTLRASLSLSNHHVGGC
jgi:hypothetical protein